MKLASCVCYVTLSYNDLMFVPRDIDWRWSNAPIIEIFVEANIRMANSGAKYSLDDNISAVRNLQNLNHIGKCQLSYVLRKVKLCRPPCVQKVGRLKFVIQLGGTQSKVLRSFLFPQEWINEWLNEWMISNNTTSNLEGRILTTLYSDNVAVCFFYSC